jgi:hypothetical protein
MAIAATELWVRNSCFASPTQLSELRALLLSSSHFSRSRGAPGEGAPLLELRDGKKEGDPLVPEQRKDFASPTIARRGRGQS